MASGREYTMLFKLSAELGSSFGSSFNSAKNPVLGLQTEINKLNKAQSDISAYKKQQGAVDATRQKLKMLQQQYDNIQREMTETGDSSAGMKNKLIAKQNQIDRTSESLKNHTEKLDTMDAALDKAGISTKDLAGESKRLDSEIDELKASQEDAARAADDMGTSMTGAIQSAHAVLAATGLVVLVKQLYDGMKASAEAAIAFESAMAGVDKTSDLTAAELEAMGDAFQRMSTEIPVSANALASIAEVAGQLGVAKGDIEDFTAVMAKLSTATTMTAEEGATMLAQFANIVQMDPGNYERLASTIVDLGNNYATTEQKILNMAQGMAASADIVGMSEADIMGLSAAISSLGIESQAGATSASKLMVELQKAVKTGKGLEDFARVAGMTGRDFAQAWGEDAAGALSLFIQGLDDAERNGKTAIEILEELGITEVRMQRMMLSLAGSGDLLNRALETSNQAWRDNTALQEEAEKRYGTTESKVELAKNAFENLKVTLGEHLTPIIGAVADAINDVVTGINDWMEKNPELTQAILIGIGVFALGAAGVGIYTVAVNAATLAMAAMKLAIPGVGWVLGGILALGAVAAAFVYLKGQADKAAETFTNLDSKFDETMALMSENNKVLDLADEYTTLSEKIDGGKTAVEEYASAQTTLWESWKSGDLSTKEYEDKLQILRDSYGSSLTGINDYSQKEQELWDSWQSGDISIASYQEKLEELRGDYGLNFNEADEYRKKEQELWDSWTSGDISTDEYKDKLEGLRTQYGENLTATEEFRAKEDELWQALITGKIPIDDYTQELDKIRAKYSETQEALKAYQEKEQALWDAYTSGEMPLDEYEDALLALRNEYGANNLSAEELVKIEERLSQVKQELRDKSGGLITATDEETEAFGRQAQALQTIIEMEQAVARQRAYENLTKQSKAYRDAIDQEERSSLDLASAQEKQERVVGIIGEGYDATTEKAYQLIESIIAVRNSDFALTPKALEWDASAVNEVEEILFALTGESYDFSGNLMNAYYVLEDLDKTSTGFRESWASVNDEVALYQGEVFAAQEVQDAFLQNLIDGAIVGGITLEEYETMLTETFSGYENGAQIVADLMAQVAAATQEAATATGDLGAGMMTTEEQTLALQTAMDGAKAKMDALAEAYTQVYDSALASINGQLKLFEEMQKPEKTLSADQMLETLNQQSAYLESYTANIQKATDLGVAPELVKQLSDGSVESAAHLETIINSGNEKIAELNAAFGKVSEGKETFAGTLAEIQTNFTATMTEIQTQLAADITAMNLSSEAAASGSATVQGFIDGAKSMQGAVTAAYAAIADAAAAALKIELDIESPSKVTTEIGKYTGMGLIEGAVSQQAGFSRAMHDLARAGVDAYQSTGLLDALGPGAFEQNGTIYVQTQQSALAARPAAPAGSTVSLQVSPVYNITGNTRPDAIRSTLQQHDSDLRAMVLDIVAEAGIDEQRRRYDA